MTTRVLIAATAGGVTFASVGVLAHAGPLALARLGVLGAALVSAALFDLTQRRIPNRIVLPAAAICAALTLAAGAPLSLLAGVATVLLLLIVSLRWPAALGMGDVKLALLLVLCLDGDALRALALGLLLAALAGLALLIRHGRAAWRTSLPLAPFLVLGALLTVIA
jgi:leader peptidase (prepilin peptidase) / N-methyltransferase